jgi:hypothetical protein
MYECICVCLHVCAYVLYVFKRLCARVCLNMWLSPCLGAAHVCAVPGFEPRHPGPTASTNHSGDGGPGIDVLPRDQPEVNEGMHVALCVCVSVCVCVCVRVCVRVCVCARHCMHAEGTACFCPLPWVQIAERVMRSGGKLAKPHRRLGDKGVAQHTLPGHEEDTFHPQING